MNAEELTSGILRGDRSHLARGITALESSLSGDQRLGAEILRACLVQNRSSLRIAVTGAPGVGKSSFIEALGGFLAAQGRKVAVLAVDPSSPRSGGSILGDKTRMIGLAAAENAFIRPSPSRMHTGGVGCYTRQAAVLCEAAGYEVIIIETVGAGQGELVVGEIADVVLLLFSSNGGDDLQLIKRGITEIADAILITKADGDNRIKAERVKAQFAMARDLLPIRPSGLRCEIEICSALTSENIESIWKIVLRLEGMNGMKCEMEDRRHKERLAWGRPMGDFQKTSN